MTQKNRPKFSINILIALIVIIAVFAGLLYFIISDIRAQNYPSVKLTIGPNLPKAITSFNFDSLNPEVDGVITESNHTVTLTVPSGTDITNLAPTIQVSDGATINPQSGTGQDF